MRISFNKYLLTIFVSACACNNKENTLGPFLSLRSTRRQEKYGKKIHKQILKYTII